MSELRWKTATANVERGVLVVLLFALLAVSGKAGWIEAKARLAQLLIADAWQNTLDSGAPQRPWPWADTWPVARLQTPEGQDLYVLESASGEALAFGPGRIPFAGSRHGGLIIAGHRDTHFRFLKDLHPGDTLLVEELDSGIGEYRVTATEVVDSRLVALRPPSSTPELVLVSCYPFDASEAGGPMRYVVHAFRQSTIASAGVETSVMTSVMGGGAGRRI